MNENYVQFDFSMGGFSQGRLTIRNRYTHHEIKLKFSALLKDYDLKYAENSKKNVTETCTRFNIP